MIKTTPREYQKAILETSLNSNTLVVLPTGLGKTLIALLLSIERLKKHPGSKVLFLAPTKPLVEQHFSTYKEQLPELFADLQIFTGSVPPNKRQHIFNTADIIFSTPQCISNDLKSSLYNLNDVSLLIMDEAHRCLKNYSYTHVVNAYKSQSNAQRILGLTASPGSEQKIIKEICSHLNIENIELRTRDSPDVKPYLQELEFEKIMVPFPQEFIEIKVLLKRIYDSCVDKLRSRKLLFGPANKITLLNLQHKLAPRIQARDFNAIAGISLTAQAIKIAHALELLETQTLSGLDEYLLNLIKQADEKKSRAVQTLVKSPEFNAARISLQQLRAKKIEHPKIEELAVRVENEFKTNQNSKIMVFCQFRETAQRIVDRLNKINNVKSSIFIGQAKKNNSGLSQKEQKEILDKFRTGEINILVATAIGEEGLDIIEIGTVIFYEPIPSEIRKIQRAGRTARLSPGKLLILITKDTRDVGHHYASSAKEKNMYKSIEIIKKELDKKPKTLHDFPPKN